jgi:hypothetical protein
MTQNFTDTKKRLAHHAITVNRTGEGNEHRINYKGGREETAYYTDDHKDAYGTGLAMAKNAIKEHEHPYWAGDKKK